MSEAETIVLPPVRPIDDLDGRSQLDPRYEVLIHNDSVTTFDYVIHVLNTIFLLSEELAEHIAQIAHHNETAVVVVRPKSEASKLAKLANSQARMDGYPLLFSIQQAD